MDWIKKFMNFDLGILMQNVIITVKEASEIIEKEAFTVKQKDSPSNLVTSADLKIQNFLNERLCELLPLSSCLGEENDNFHDAEYKWVVDPIDGTANFSRGIDECAISVALIHNDEALLGVVYNPFKNQLFTAQKGKGAFCNGEPIHVSNKHFEEGIICTAWSLYKKEYAPLCTEIISEIYASCNDIRRFGACTVELCYLASGKCDLYFEFRLYPWDYAAAQLILKEAGGVCATLGGNDLPFDRTTMVMAANNNENLQKLLEIIGKHIKEIPYEQNLK